jgi:glycosyltransferase involved in cell wall biosynthesis
MRVLQVSKFTHHVGGVETYLRWITAGLSGARHTVGVLGMAPPAGQQLMDFPTDVPLWLTPTREYAPGSSHRARSAALAVWSPSAGQTMKRALADFRPDVVHFHGTCHQLTSAVVRVVARAGVPAVLTTHEAKLICANQTLWDDAQERVCTACLGATPAQRVMAPVRRACMKGSHAVSALGALETQISRPVWKAADPVILAPSRFMQRSLISDGWRRDRVGYLDLPWRPESERVPLGSNGRDSITFVGRLVKLKGADVLLRAWAEIAHRHPSTRVRILGEGPERSRLEQLTRDLRAPRVEFLGYCQPGTVSLELARALVTLHPAQWHENSPFSVRESLMAGVPAMVTDLGGVPEMVGPSSGWVVRHDDARAWASQLDIALRSGLAGSQALRAQVEARAMTSENHLRELVSVYHRCTSVRKGSRTPPRLDVVESCETWPIGTNTPLPRPDLGTA